VIRRLLARIRLRQDYGLRLLGDGLDDIIQRTSRRLPADVRLYRFQRARVIATPASGVADVEARRMRTAQGQLILNAWCQGRYPNFAKAFEHERRAQEAFR